VRSGALATNTTYPGKISQLANAIAAASTASHNSCGSGGGVSNFTTTAVTSWNTSGPFVTFMINAGGLVTPIGTIADSMVRTPATSGLVGTLALRMFAVDLDDAVMLDRVVDGGDSLLAGTVQWVANAGTPGTVDIRYFIPVGARC
jgi:hypothetical protein